MRDPRRPDSRMQESQISGGRISEEMMFILRALADEVKTTVVDTLKTNLDKSASIV